MDENRPPAGRSGLPRPMSRLPTPRSTVIRQTPSKDNLAKAATAATAAAAAAAGGGGGGGGGEGGEGEGGEGSGEQGEPKAPRLLCSAASREHLASGSVFGRGGSITGIAPPTAEAAPKPVTTSISNSTRALPRPRPVSSLPTIRSQPSLPKSSSTNNTNNGHSRLPRDPMASLYEEAQEQQPTSRLPGLRKRPSLQYMSQKSLTRNRTPSMTSIPSGGAFNDSQFRKNPVDEEGTLGDETVRAMASKSRPSLAERTIETLSHLSPSPALRSKASGSSFFEPEPFALTSRPASRRDSRPPSSRRSESSNPPSRRMSPSRPGSSSGPGQDLGLSSPLRSRLPSFDATPSRGRNMGTLMRTPSKVGLNGIARSQMATPSTVRMPRSRTPSIDALNLDPTSPTGPRTAAARPLHPMPSVSSPLKKPAVPVVKKMNTPALTPRKGSITSQKSSTTASGEETTFSAASTTSNQTAASGPESPPPQFKKSSAALREQIARAKAAKRVVPAADEAPQLGGTAEMPVIPTDNTFDFGLTDDPFNLKRDASSASKVLQGRVATARTSGRLNIAALGLKEIPVEVLNMYSLESIGKSDGSWAESVDLTRFVAADNELEMIDDKLFPDVDPEELAEQDEDFQGCLFGGLETLDLHGNMLISLPAGLRRLTLLTSLNLSSNRLANNCLEPISQVTPLRDLKLGGNLLWGTLESCFGRLSNLEILDLHGNNLQGLPPSFAELHRLRILNLAENSFESLPFGILSKLPLTELIVRKNKLSGILIEDGIESLPTMQNLDVSSNQLTGLVRPNVTLAMPALTQLCVSMNRIQALPDVSSWFELATLSADENSINAFPDGFTSLEKLRSAEFSSNDIRTVPAEIARMDSLAMLRLSGNPLRDKKFVSVSTEELKEMLAARLAPPSAIVEGLGGEDGLIAEAITSDEVSHLGSAFELSAADQAHGEHDDDDDRTDTDDFATPPTSTPASPTTARSSSVALSWEVKPGGVLDRSNSQSSSLHPVACSKLANNHQIRQVHLQHNLFASLPDSLSFFAETLTTLSLAHNQLVGETYLGSGEVLELPALKELNLSSNHITSLGPLMSHLLATNLEKLDVSVNRIASLPSSSDKEKGGQLLRDAYPRLTILLAANNHLAELDHESIRGFKIVDVSNNDIAHLKPHIGLLGGPGGLERFDATGNRFRVPRFNVLERGTEATLRWLRGRVPVAEMAAWKAERGVVGEDDASDVD